MVGEPRAASLVDIRSSDDCLEERPESVMRLRRQQIQRVATHVIIARAKVAVTGGADRRGGFQTR